MNSQSFGWLSELGFRVLHMLLELVWVPVTNKALLGFAVFMMKPRVQVTGSPIVCI